MTTGNNTTDDTHTIESSELEPKLLDMMKHAAETGAEITVTEDGHPLLHLATTKPTQQSPSKKGGKPAFGKYRHLLISYGDITSPIDEDWEAKFDKKWDEKLGTA